MTSILIHPAYFGPISQYVALVQADQVVFEQEDHYQKQTYRNRMYIYEANGRLLLNIPIRHLASLTGEKRTPGKHQLYKEVRIENHFHWQKLHWRGLKSAYQASPFFEFYEDELLPLYHRKYVFLMDFNDACLEFTTKCLQLDLNREKTTAFTREPEGVLDFRSLIDPKDPADFSPEPYHQVFQNKHGFLPDLCILDLLFNEGPSSLAYLQKQQLRVPGVT